MMVRKVSRLDNVGNVQIVIDESASFNSGLPSPKNGYRGCSKAFVPFDLSIMLARSPGMADLGLLEGHPPGSHPLGSPNLRFVIRGQDAPGTS
jgi:hypothetical protein